MEIKGNSTTQYLSARWIGCYLVYDNNLLHADNAFNNNLYDWKLEAKKRAGENADENRLTRIYNLVLSEKVEDFIKHLITKTTTRAEIEAYIAEEIVTIDEHY